MLSNKDVGYDGWKNSIGNSNRTKNYLWVQLRHV